jgi:hypothetical protein
MRITEYIKNKNDIRLFNLSGNQKIIDDLELSKLPVKSTYSKIDNKNFSDNCLVIIIINSSLILDGSIFKSIVGLNNILVLIVFDSFFIQHETECKDAMISHGYRYFGNTSNDKAVIFIYDISKYKETPDWLNSDNWANPELWEK